MKFLPLVEDKSQGEAGKMMVYLFLRLYIYCI